MKRLLAAALVAGCATSSVAPRTSTEVGVADIDEQGLWRLAGEAQAELDQSGRLYVDPDLEGYLQEVARRLEPPEVFAAIPFRFRVMRERTPNAFCLPNGAIYLNTGILALAEDEAELAMLLAHEMTHAVGRHALKALRASENTGAVLNVLASWTGAAARRGGLVFMASVAGYNRDLEREADHEAWARLVAAGYDAGEAPRLFERLKDWVAAEKLPPRRSFYASHPKLEERIKDLGALAAAGAPAPGAPAGERGAERYQARTAGVLLDGARGELASGRLGAARRLGERYVAARPADPKGHQALGEIERRQGTPGADDAALASYRRALELDARLPEAWRGMGLLLQRRGDRAGAREALSRYLELAPDAPDRAHVSAMLREPSGGSP